MLNRIFRIASSQTHIWFFGENSYILFTNTNIDKYDNKFWYSLWGNLCLEDKEFKELPFKSLLTHNNKWIREKAKETLNIKG